MSVLRRLVLHSSNVSTILEEPETPGTRPMPSSPVRGRSPDVWNRVLDVLNRRIAVMEENIEKATDDWADLQGMKRNEWEIRMRSYAYALEELHALADTLTASRNEIP